MTEIKTIYPMLATSGSNKDKWESPEWWAEEKIDGARYLMNIVENGNRFTSRQKSRQTGLPVEKTDNVPHLSKLYLNGLEGTILDGEIRHKDFSKTISVMGSLPIKAVALQGDIGWIDYHAFDILEYKGKDVRDYTYQTRRELLEKVIEEIDFKYIKTTTLVKEDKRKYYEEVVKQGGEGVILKQVNSKYKNGIRCKEWIKVKKYMTDDVVIMGADLPTKLYTGKDKYNWNYIRNGVPVTRAWHKGWIGSIIFGKYINGELTELGRTSGIEDNIKELLSNGEHGLKEEYIGQVMEIGAMEKIKKSRAYRHPRFIRLRPDKSAEECIE